MSWIEEFDFLLELVCFRVQALVVPCSCGVVTRLYLCQFFFVFCCTLIVAVGKKVNRCLMSRCCVTAWLFCFLLGINVSKVCLIRRPLSRHKMCPTHFRRRARIHVIMLKVVVAVVVSSCFVIPVICDSIYVFAPLMRLQALCVCVCVEGLSGGCGVRI